MKTAIQSARVRFWRVLFIGGSADVAGASLGLETLGFLTG